MKRSWMICDGMYFIAFLDTEFYLINAKVTEKSASCSEIIRHWVISELNECLYRADTIVENRYKFLTNICTAWGLLVTYLDQLQPFNSQDLTVNSSFALLHISFYIGYKNLVLDLDKNFYLISLSILFTILQENVGI